MKQQELEKVLKKMCDEIERCSGCGKDGFILLSRTNLQDMSKEARILMNTRRVNRAQDRRIANGGEHGGPYE